MKTWNRGTSSSNLGHGRGRQGDDSAEFTWSMGAPVGRVREGGEGRGSQQRGQLSMDDPHMGRNCDVPTG